MKLEVSRVALETIATLRPLVPRIRRYDRSLAVQLVRAASSLALNLGEGEYSDPGTQRARYCNAAGSANETRTALAVAVAWGYLTSAQAEPASCHLDRVIAMLWKLTHR
jgi:four helix bundle protein